MKHCIFHRVKSNCCQIIRCYHRQDQMLLKKHLYLNHLHSLKIQSCPISDAMKLVLPLSYSFVCVFSLLSIHSAVVRLWS